MKILETDFGDNLFDVARKAVKMVAEKHEHVTIRFNGIETLVDAEMTLTDVVVAHQEEITRLRDLRRAASPAFKIARDLLDGQSEVVKTALRELLRPDD